mmetsp:Transcript_79219/g.183831  ORF Transcript_79219/g.183831 Transcript_79219/m.183831 type:complete len:365 (+) Transcript_79219:89-1183(+)
MGTCAGKEDRGPVGDLIDPTRKRFSVLEPDGAAGGGLLDLQPCILPLLGESMQKLSVQGSSSTFGQKGFADKRTVTEQFGGGEEVPLNFKVGWACKKGLKPESPNQDDFCVFCADGASIYGVFDGHGPCGHDVSNFVQTIISRNFAQHPLFHDDPEKALSAAFLQTQNQCIKLQAEGQLDCSLSGTTATLAMQRDSVLYIAHVGDSRAVLARMCDGHLECEDLTNDHKPTCDGERRRIEAAGGEVRRLDGDIPHRVFLRGKMYPGLAMTRALGDTVGTIAGVTSLPEVSAFKIKDNWQFMLLCSDGVWEFMTSHEAVELVHRFAVADVQKAAETLAAEAWTRWIQEEGNVVDDITVVCVWFRGD